jgi:hypothetical protein
MSLSHFQRIDMAVANPASRAVTIHVALRASVFSEISSTRGWCLHGSIGGSDACARAGRARDGPVKVARVESCERFGCLQPEEDVSVPDCVEEGASSEDDLPRRVLAGEEAVQAAEPEDPGAARRRQVEPREPEQEHEPDLFPHPIGQLCAPRLSPRVAVGPPSPCMEAGLVMRWRAEVRWARGD